MQRKTRSKTSLRQARLQGDTFRFFRRRLSLIEAQKLTVVSKNWRACSISIDPGFYHSIVIHGSMLLNPALFDDQVLERLLIYSGGKLQELYLGKLPSLEMTRNSAVVQILRSQKHLVTCSIINCSSVRIRHHIEWISQCSKLKRLSLRGCILDDTSLKKWYKMVQDQLPNLLFDLDPCKKCLDQNDNYNNNVEESSCIDCKHSHKCSECQQFFFARTVEHLYLEYSGMECMGCHRLLCPQCSETHIGGSKKLKWGCDSDSFRSECIEKFHWNTNDIASRKKRVRKQAGIMSYMCAHNSCPSCALNCPNCERQYCVVSFDDTEHRVSCNTFFQCVCCDKRFCQHCAWFRFGDMLSPCSMGEVFEDCDSYICKLCWENDHKLKTCCDSCSMDGGNLVKFCEPCLTGGCIENLTPRIFENPYTCGACGVWSCGMQNCERGLPSTCGACETIFCENCANASYEGKQDKLEWEMFSDCRYKVDTERSTENGTRYMIPKTEEDGYPHDFCCGNCAVECKRINMLVCSVCYPDGYTE